MISFIMSIDCTMKYCRNCGQPPESEDKCKCGAPPKGGRGFCNFCGNPTYADEAECPNCQNPLETGLPTFKKTIVASAPPKDPSMIAALSVIPFPWLGQIFLGQTAKGVSMLILTYVLSTFLIGLVMLPIAAIDAYKLAKVLQNGGAIGPWDFFWSIKEKDAT